MFEFIVDPLLPPIIIICGIIGLAYGINKLLKSKEDESSSLKYLALGASIVVGVLNIIAIFEAFIDNVDPIVQVHWLTIILIFLAGSTMLSEPLKETPLAAVMAIIVSGALVGLLLLFADLNDNFVNVELFGALEIPLWLLIIVIVVIVGIIFLITVFTEFTVDRILQIFSWSPIVIIFCGLLLIQGILIILLGYGGIWELVSSS
jgi:hypothetical protein